MSEVGIVDITRIALLTIYSLKHNVPKNRTDLEYYKDPWIFLLSTVLSIRSRDIFVNKWISENINRVSLKNLSKLSRKDMRVLFKPFGLDSKSDTVYDLTSLLRDKDLRDFNWHLCREIKGVGTKVWRVFSNIYLEEYSIAVDTHTRQMFNLLTKCNWNVNRIDKYLNDKFRNKFYQKWVHIVLVRWNKKSYWCDQSCNICKQIQLLLFNQK